MRSVLAGLRTLVLPWGAGPTDAQILLGSDIPAEIELDGNGFPMIAVIIWRLSADAYYFEGISSNGFIESYWTGIFNDDATVDKVTWTTETTISGGGLATAAATLTYGTFVNGTASGTEPGGFSRQALLIDYDKVSQRIGGNGTDPVLSSWAIDGKAAPRGMWGRIDSAANSAAIGAETVILTIPAADIWNGRAYRCTWQQRLTASVAQTATVRVRRTNAAGQLLDVWQWVYAAAQSLSFDHSFYFKRTLGAGTLNTAIVLTLQASAGTSTAIGAATEVRHLTIEDVGAANDYTNAIAIV